MAVSPPATDALSPCSVRRDPLPARAGAARRHAAPTTTTRLIPRSAMSSRRPSQSPLRQALLASYGPRPRQQHTGRVGAFRMRTSVNPVCRCVRTVGSWCLRVAANTPFAASALFYRRCGLSRVMATSATPPWWHFRLRRSRICFEASTERRALPWTVNWIGWADLVLYNPITSISDTASVRRKVPPPS